MLKGNKTSYISDLSMDAMENLNFYYIKWMDVSTSSTKGIEDKFYYLV